MTKYERSNNEWNEKNKDENYEDEYHLYVFRTRKGEPTDCVQVIDGFVPAMLNGAVVLGKVFTSKAQMAFLTDPRGLVIRSYHSNGKGDISHPEDYEEEEVGTFIRVR